MATDKLKRLQAAGWKVGNAQDFLKLSPKEATLVEIKLSLINAAKKSRIKKKALPDQPCAANEIKPIARGENRSGRSFRIA